MVRQLCIYLWAWMEGCKHTLDIWAGALTYVDCIDWRRWRLGRSIHG